MLTVLVDDDPLVRMTWKVAAKRGGHALRSFDSPAAFFSDSEIPSDAAIFVDWQLTKDGTAESFLRELSEKGYGNISIATGQAPGEIPSLPFVQAVVGKSPPWQ